MAMGETGRVCRIPVVGHRPEIRYASGRKPVLMILSHEPRRSAMFRLLVCFALVCTFATVACCAEKSASEKAISDAIKLLESRSEKAGDLLEQAKIEKAIRELEALLSEPEPNPTPTPNPKPSTKKNDNLTASLKKLKKKFGGRATYDSKTNELLLEYDFKQKLQLNDFETTNKKVLLKDSMLMIDGDDELHHVAKFKSYAVSAVMSFKSPQNSGLGATNGTSFRIGAERGGVASFKTAEGAGGTTDIETKFRSGSVPISIIVQPEKSTFSFGEHRSSAGTEKRDDSSQIVLFGGKDGCGFSNLVIVGIPDLTWFKTFLDAE
jgi:hypothetical protein